MLFAVLVIAPFNIYAIPQEKLETIKNENIILKGEISDNIFELSFDPPGLPFPGELIDNPPIFDTYSYPQRDFNHHEISLQSQDDLIISILNQLNESLFLEYLEELVAFGPRRTGTPACEQAGKYIYEQFKEMGLQARYQNWSYGGESGSNIEGTLNGFNESSDEIYIICAHYDSVTGSPGADDDGSGTVAVLVAADLLSKYAVNHTVKFVAFDGEEQGLLGSHEYAREASENGDNIIGVLNGDMIGFAITTYDGENIKIYENTASTWITEFTEEISDLYDEYIDLNIIPSGTSGGSDHYSFWQYGYDSIFYHEYNFNDYYHSPQDTIENMNITYAAKSARLMVGTLASLGQSLIPSEPPGQPIISGPSTGIEEEEYEFIFSATDPEGDNVYYYVDWGDETGGSWIGPYESGEEATITHSWSDEGNYEIQAKAKDIYDMIGEWSSPSPITIYGGPSVRVDTIGGGLFNVNSVIENPGGLEAENVNWRIEFDGGVILGKTTAGTNNIPALGEITISSKPVIGFGPTQITVYAEIPEGAVDAKTLGGFVFLFYINVNPGG
jgi:hypothetical protein